MAKPFTHEQREELKARIIGLVRKNERMTISQLERATGAGWHSVRRCLVDVLACGDLYMPGKYGVFASEQVYRWICPYISRHLLSLNPLLACCRRYSRGER